MKPEAHDDGRADDRVRAAIADAHDSESYLDAVAELCLARCFMPVLADESGAMSAVIVSASDGSEALLAFTGFDAMQAWRLDARPVPATLDDLAATVIESEADSLLIDCVGPTPFTIEQPLIDALAQGNRLVRDEQGWAWIRVNHDTEPG